MIATRAAGYGNYNIPVVIIPAAVPCPELDLHVF
jgi:hypothetical protein